MTRILFVCLGNICRSPMAESILTELAARAGRSSEFTIESAATSSEEQGNGVHPQARAALRRHGFPCIPHTARKMTRADYDRFDRIFCMDSYNLRVLRAMTGGDPDGKIAKLLDLTDTPRDVDDPWYTGEYEPAFLDILRGCEAIMRNY